jgi:alkylation response protein AidB-like acyl-CoA dehydrogenase
MAISAVERAALRDAVRDLMEQECAEGDVRRVMTSGDDYDPRLWARLAELGAAGTLIDPAYGGMGFGAAELEAVTEETGAALLPSPLISSGVLAASLLGAAAPDVRERLLPGIADGTTVATVALTGPAGTWEPDGVAVEASADGALTGASAYVTHGGGADVLLVVARAADGVGVYEIAPDAPGLTRTAEDVFDPTVPLARLAFDNAPARRIAGLGRPEVAGALDLALIALAGEQVGGARRIFEITVDYLKTRIQFGRQIGGFQALKHYAADLLLDVESATSAARHAAAEHAAGSADAGGAVALAAFTCADAFHTTAMYAIQMHGGIAFTWEHPAHLYLRRARSGRQLFGGSPLHRERYLTAKGA